MRMIIFHINNKQKIIKLIKFYKYIQNIYIYIYIYIYIINVYIYHVKTWSKIKSVANYETAHTNWSKYLSQALNHSQTHLTFPRNNGVTEIKIAAIQKTKKKTTQNINTATTRFQLNSTPSSRSSVLSALLYFVKNAEKKLSQSEMDTSREKRKVPDGNCYLK